MSTRSLTFYHGTRAELAPQHMLLAQPEPLRLTPDLDEALWSATLSPGAGDTKRNPKAKKERGSLLEQLEATDAQAILRQVEHSGRLQMPKRRRDPSL